MNEPAVIGQETVLAALRSCLVNGRVPQSLLFLGPAGSQKQELAHTFARTLLCDGKGPDPCGTCESCRLFQKQGHPDCHTLRPVGKLRQFRKDQVDDLLKFLSLKSFRGGYKTALILEADRLNDASANALLKSLEEPPGRTVFLLTASKESDLLPTILSRCQKWPLAPLSDATLEKFLETQGDLPLTIPVLARMAKGQIGNLQGERFQQLLENRTWVIQMAEDWLKRGSAALWNAADELLARLEAQKKIWSRDATDKAEPGRDLDPALKEKWEKEWEASMTGLARQFVDQALDSLAAFFRDLLLVQEGLGDHHSLHPDCRSLLEQVAGKLPRIEDRLPLLDEGRRRLDGTVNTKLALEVILLEIFKEPS